MNPFLREVFKFWFEYLRHCEWCLGGGGTNFNFINCGNCVSRWSTNFEKQPDSVEVPKFFGMGEGPELVIPWHLRKILIIYPLLKLINFSKIAVNPPFACFKLILTNEKKSIETQLQLPRSVHQGMSLCGDITKIMSKKFSVKLVHSKISWSKIYTVRLIRLKLKYWT